MLHLQMSLEKIWEKFQLGMIMNGVFLIECVILQNICTKIRNEKFMKKIEKLIDLKK